MIAVVSTSVPARNAWQYAYDKYISKIPFYRAFFLDKKSEMIRILGIDLERIETIYYDLGYYYFCYLDTFAATGSIQ